MPYHSDNLYVTVKNTRTKILTPSMVDTIKKQGYTLNVAATKI